MTDLDKIKNWLATYPGFDILGNFQVDYTDQIPSNGGIFPSGLVEISRREDILGNITVENQYNFGIYYVFPQSPGDNIGSQSNANWIMDFQRWVQEQGIRGFAPTFGNIDTHLEKIQAQNGVLYDADPEGLATYLVTLSVRYKTFYEVM